MTMGSVAFGGSLVTTRWLIVGVIGESEVAEFGQEVEVRWRGNRKDVKLDDGDVIRKRGKGVLRVNGVDVPLRPQEPLDGGYVAAAAFDAEKERFVLIRDDLDGEAPSRCFQVYRDGTVRECRLPSNYYYQPGRDYLFDQGRRLRFTDMAARPWRFLELEVDAKKTRELTDKIGTLYMSHKLAADGSRDQTFVYGTPSPDSVFIVRTLARKMEFTSENGTIDVNLPDSPQGLGELSPLGSMACRSHLDSINETPWEREALIWNHAGSRVYDCGLKSEAGFVVEPRSGIVVRGPCLRGASWSRDDSIVAGVADCGHRVEVWRVDRDSPVVRAP